MANFIIEPSDYVDLDETLSDKNIINTIDGKEYVITKIEGTQLDTRSINPETTSKIFSSSPFTNDTAKYNGNLIVYSNLATAGNWLFEADRDWARSETLYFSGSYEFTTEEVIVDENSISCSFNINYTKSKAGNLYNDMYNVMNRTQFFGHLFQFPHIVQEGDDNLSTNEFLPAQQGTAIAQFLWAKAEAVAPMPSAREYCEAKIINKTASSTTIRVSYRFKIWAGWTTDNQQNNTVLSVNNITINTVANTVDTDEVHFSYQTDLVDVEKKYELETNELFQVQSTDPIEDRLSYQTYEKITSSYDTDRRIITFTLLNPIKVEINDATKYEIGETKERYIDVDDEFNIKDEHSEWILNNAGGIAVFKVIQCNPIWNGSYQKRITAIMLDDTI